MSDLTPHSRHPYLDSVKHIVAIGGGHGLGRVMSALSFMKERLTGIVTTTDNGGSTGRIRMQQGGIAWGDLRNCLNQIITEPSTASALFEYRFSGQGELAGHNLGNLMLTALGNLYVRPTEAVNLIRELLHVKSFIIPMSESSVHLAASLPSGESIVGEVGIDNLDVLPKSVFLVPLVSATPEAVEALNNAEVILFGPGSFLTSIMPPLLLPEIVQSLQQSSAKKIFIDNLGVEHSPVAALSLSERIDWIHDVIGKKIIDGAIIPINSPEKDRTFNCKIMARRLNADDVSYRHDRTLLCKAIDDMLSEL
ncbi:gluconeogenesis factor YvcK family protein [[Pasteurella] aerogenes]|nr:uridine diphosphate-N-acetylglucosamine-binding protein YvcK [[Pasteurella] aerogenes]MCU9997532.1 uridine diphosphate-N-acetylglucosamine-binding protein YvcK [[Pasteurella] aerogenes]MDY2795614.1 uridine diphosphate-N-acetylglucosamine-binding protein YvcK [[Pasteurella] aerogenes]MDY4478818.1 uridine diphosphate-N-acetylglucosamine-binding protein YvcK [[Pasteurella] aerogenes]VEG70097.1 LPPG:FO 2-phospho-L-lactate transferase family protein [[Pasteurella] aerogenes]